MAVVHPGWCWHKGDACLNYYAARQKNRIVRTQFSFISNRSLSEKNSSSSVSDDRQLSLTWNNSQKTKKRYAQDQRTGGSKKRSAGCLCVTVWVGVTHNLSNDYSSHQGGNVLRPCLHKIWVSESGHVSRTLFQIYAQNLQLSFLPIFCSTFSPTPS